MNNILALVFLFIPAILLADTTYLCNLPTAAARAYGNREARPGDEISFWTGTIAGRLVSSTATDNSVNLEGLWNTILPQLRWSSELRINASSGAIIAEY